MQALRAVRVRVRARATHDRTSLAHAWRQRRRVDEAPAGAGVAAQIATSRTSTACRSVIVDPTARAGRWMHPRTRTLSTTDAIPGVKGKIAQMPYQKLGFERGSIASTTSASPGIDVAVRHRRPRSSEVTAMPVVRA